MASSKSRKAKRGRARKRKQKQRRLEGPKSKLERGPFRGRKVILEPRGQEKMSEVLSEFVEPYLEFLDTEEACRKLLTLAVMAWNASFLSEEEQQDMVDRVLDAAMPADSDELKTGLKEIVSMLIARKKAHFSEYRRNIIDFELTDTGRGYHLAVVSTPGGMSSQ